MLRHRRYEVIEELSEGVSLARDLLTDGKAKVVLKEIPAGEQRDPESVAEEFRILSSLSHPAIVSVVDLGFDQTGGRYLTTEYVPGDHLDRLLPRATGEQVHHLLCEATAALSYAHRCGVIHGDLKPANIITRLEPTPELVLVDFGLSQALFGARRKVGGTPGYIAPEVLAGARPGVRSDLYALGVAFFAALTGGLPGASVGDELERCRPDLPAVIRESLCLLTAREPSSRPVNADSLLRRLGRPVPRAAPVALPFVGRREVLDRVIRARATVTRIRGARGIGKSRLLREARLRLQLAGRLAISVRHLPFDARPFGPLPYIVSMVAHVAGEEPSVQGRDHRAAKAPEKPQHPPGPPRSPPTNVSRLPEEAGVIRKESAHFWRRFFGMDWPPSFRTPTPPPERLREERADLPEAKDALAVSERAFSALRASKQLAPVLLIDDLDTASPAAIALISYLARGCLQERCASLILATTEGAIDEQLEAEIPGAEVVELGPIGVDSVDELTTAALGHRDQKVTRWVWERSGGTPAFVVESLQGIGPRTEAGEIDLSSGSPLCPSVASAGRLEGFGDIDQAVLRTLAALGRSVSLDELALLVDGAGRDVVFRLEGAGLVQIRAGLLSLASGSVASVLLEEAPFGPLSVVHREIAGRLKERGASPREVNRHLAAAGDVEAALKEAKALAEQGAPLRAYAQVAPEVVEKIQTSLEAKPRNALLWVEVAARAGEFRVAQSMAEALVDHRDPSIRGEALMLLGDAFERLGELSKARDRLETALPLLTSATLRQQTMTRLARVANLTGQHAAAADYARAGLGEAGVETRGEVEAGLRVQLAGALDALGASEEALTELESARRAAEASGSRRVMATVLGHLAIARTRRGSHEKARALYSRALSEAEAAGDVASLPAHLLNLAIAYQTQPDPAAALTLFRRAEVMARRIGRTGPLATALVNLANLYAELGATDEGRLAAQEALTLAEQSGLCIVEGQALLVLAEIAAMTATPEAAQLAARARELFTAAGAPERGTEALVLEGEVALAGGDIAAARSCLTDARSGTDVTSCEPRLDLLEGEILRAEGAAGAAADMIERALAGADRSGAADLSAKAEMALASLLEEVGSPEAATHKARAVERLTTLALRVPPELRECFWAVPHRARSRAAEPERSREGAAFRLLDLAPRIVAERDAERVLERALDAGIDVTGAERGFLLLNDGHRWKVAAARNIDREALRRPARKFSVSIAEEVARTGEPLLTANAQGDPRLVAARSVHQLALESVVCVPIRSPEQILGTLYLENRFSRGRFDGEDLRLAMALADQVALALEAGRLERELRERAVQLDEAKTELANRVERQEDELARLEREVRRSQAETALRHEYSGIVGRSATMQRLLQTIDRVTDTSLPVLIEGETGTGKELVARALHQNGPRRNHPFVSVNCGALPDLLLESELFGHLRGAFTGADRTRTGLLREASGGTFFLDEIGEMSASMQVKLLRAIQNAEITPLGSERPVQIDVRFIAATHRRLAEMVTFGRFRQDLFYRLNVITITVPPLRERREDIPHLAEHLLQRVAKQLGREPPRLDRSALSALFDQELPGNVRELENLLSTAAALCNDDTIRAKDLPHHPIQPSGSFGRSSLRSLRASDRQTLKQALASSGFNISKTARRLGVSRPTVYRWLKENGVEWRRR